MSGPPRSYNDGGHRLRLRDWHLVARLWPYVRRQRWGLAVALFVALPVSALQILQPALLKVAIDDYMVVGDPSGLGSTALMYLALLVAEQLFIFAQLYLLQWVGQRTMQRLQEELHSHVLGLDQPYFDRTSVGGLVTRLTSDIEALNEFFASGAVSIVTDVVLLLGIVGTMFFVDRSLAGVALAFVPPLVVVSIVYGVLLRRAQRLVRGRLAELNSRLQEDVDGLEVVQLFGREEDRRVEFARRNEAYFVATRTAIRYDSQLFALVDGLSSTAIAAVVWYGAYGIAGGALAFGVLKMFMQYILRFFVPIRDMSAKFAVIQSAMAAAERVFSLLRERPAVQAPDAPHPLGAFQDWLQFDGVTFAYDGQTEVLRDVSFSVRKGERVALVGATGAGKSTVAKLLTRQYDPTQGRISIDGVDLRDLSYTRIGALFGVVPQDVVIFEDTVRENVRLGDPAVDDEAAEAALRAVGAASLLDTDRGGLARSLRGSGGELSSGERQLLTYARALAHDPEILVLDEATSAVDHETERAIERATEVLLRGRTAIVIAHRLTTIRSVDRVLVFHAGRIREQGSHDELVAAGGIYAQLHALQYRPVTR